VVLKGLTAWPAGLLKLLGPVPVWAMFVADEARRGSVRQAVSRVVPSALAFVAIAAALRCPLHWGDISGHVVVYLLAAVPWVYSRGASPVGIAAGSVLAVMALCTGAVFHQPDDVIVALLAAGAAAGLAHLAVAAGLAAFASAVAAVLNAWLVVSMPEQCRSASLSAGSAAFDACVLLGAVGVSVLSGRGGTK